MDHFVHHPDNPPPVYTADTDRGDPLLWTDAEVRSRLARLGQRHRATSRQVELLVTTYELVT